MNVNLIQFIVIFAVTKFHTLPDPVSKEQGQDIVIYYLGVTSTFNLDHLTTAILKFWPWLIWLKIFDHSTMTPGRRPNGQIIKVILLPLLTCAA